MESVGAFRPRNERNIQACSISSLDYTDYTNVLWRQPSVSSVLSVVKKEDTVDRDSFDFCDSCSEIKKVFVFAMGDYFFLRVAR